MCRQVEIDPYFSLCTKLKSKQFKVRNLKLDTLNLTELGNCPEYSTGDNFLNRTPMAQALRSTIHKWDLVKLKSFCKTKDTIKRIKRTPIFITYQS